MISYIWLWTIWLWIYSDTQSMEVVHWYSDTQTNEGYSLVLWYPANGDYSLSLSFFQSASWHLSINPLHPKILFIPGHLLLILPLLIFGSTMRKPVRTSQRTFLDEAFMRNAKSFYWISSILTFPLSSTVGVGSHCVVSQSLFLPWSFKTFTPTYMGLIIQYLTLSLAFKVCVLWSLRILYPRCYMSQG